MEYLQQVANETNATQFKELTLKYINLLEGYALKVPEFQSQFEWINTEEKLTFETHLKNKLCVLDFFTYCCINCMHVLPDLHQLEERYPIQDGLAVIGVHSAKFQNEKLLVNILNAVLRYNINHAVVNDADAIHWNLLNIQCWPTFVVVSPQGKVLLYLVGEGHSEVLTKFVGVALEYYKAKDLISDHLLPIKLAKDTLNKETLKFPGKLSPSVDGKNIAISDTGNHQIILATNKGVLYKHIGNGQPGFKDGSFAECEFNSPQGLTWLNENVMFVADTENHAIRMIDLEHENVSTLTGTGVQGNDKEGGKKGVLQKISSPWDVLVANSPGSESSNDVKACIYIAMAGTHQIWCYFLEDATWLRKGSQEEDTCLRFAGSGNEENRNNSYPHKASFAQPSGFTVAIVKEQKHLYIADSESSSIRSLEIKSGSVKACVGGERDPTNLFAYGDIDGKGANAKLQHPLSVAFNPKDGFLYVADSYNHKIKFIDPVTMICTSLCGSGRAGYIDGSFTECEFNEPGDVKVHGNHLYVADTNNHKIRLIDLEKKQVSTLSLLQPDELDSPMKTMSVDSRKDLINIKVAKLFSFPCMKVNIKAGGTKIMLNLTFTDGLKFNADAESRVKISYVDEQNKDVLSTDSQKLGSVDNKCVVESHFPAAPSVYNMLMKVELLLYLCSEDQTCYMKQHLLNQPLIHEDNSNDIIQIKHQIST